MVRQFRTDQGNTYLVDGKLVSKLPFNANGGTETAGLFLNNKHGTSMRLPCSYRQKRACVFAGVDVRPVFCDKQATCGSSKRLQRSRQNCKRNKLGVSGFSAAAVHGATELIMSPSRPSVSRLDSLMEGLVNPTLFAI